MEFKIISTEHSGTSGIKQLEQEINDAAADGWRYQATMSTSRWGTGQNYAATVLMYRETVPRRAKTAQHNSPAELGVGERILHKGGE